LASAQKGERQSSAFEASPVSKAAFDIKGKSPVPITRAPGSKRESLPGQETFNFKAESAAQLHLPPTEDKAPCPPRVAAKAKSPGKPRKSRDEFSVPKADGDTPQSRKRKANAQIQKLGVSPAPPTSLPPPAAPPLTQNTDLLVEAAKASLSNGHPVVNGHPVPPTNGHTAQSTNGHPVPSTNGHLKVAAKSSVEKTTSTTSLETAKTTIPVDLKAAEAVFGPGPITLNERTLRLLGLTDDGWNSMLLKSRLAGGSLPLESTFICFECGRDAVAEKKRLMKCKRCKIASYCDQKCQGVNWPKHKRVCKLVANHENAEDISTQDIVCI